MIVDIQVTGGESSERLTADKQLRIMNLSSPKIAGA